jgi:alpha-tubulin suppressor-like RCC1 family protein
LGNLTFAIVSAGGSDTCGLDLTGAAYCWGENGGGRLGDGTTANRGVPTAVMGGLTFISIVASGLRSCGVAVDRQAYCWGTTSLGAISLTPALIPGALWAGPISSVGGHFCAIAAANIAYCWGDNEYGQLGDGRQDDGSGGPYAVVGDLSLMLVSAGSDHTCGITTARIAYCWGYNGTGQLGIGTMGAPMSSPVPVETGGR